MLHLRQLQCALALAECGSFQLAADRLGITPSGLTQSIQILESYHDCILFTRSRAGVSLTPKGEIIIEGAQKIIQRAYAMEREINLANNPEAGKYRKNKPPFPCVLNVLKAGSVVKHGDNRSKDNCIPVQLAQKNQRFCRILALQAKDAQG